MSHWRRKDFLIGGAQSETTHRVVSNLYNNLSNLGGHMPPVPPSGSYAYVSLCFCWLLSCVYLTPHRNVLLHPRQSTTKVSVKAVSNPSGGDCQDYNPCHIWNGCCLAAFCGWSHEIGMGNLHNYSCKPIECFDVLLTHHACLIIGEWCSLWSAWQATTLPWRNRCGFGRQLG